MVTELRTCNMSRWRHINLKKLSEEFAYYFQKYGQQYRSKNIVFIKQTISRILGSARTVASEPSPEKVPITPARFNQDMYFRTQAIGSGLLLIRSTLPVHSSVMGVVVVYVVVTTYFNKALLSVVIASCLRICSDNSKLCRLHT